MIIVGALIFLALLTFLTDAVMGRRNRSAATSSGQLPTPRPFNATPTVAIRGTVPTTSAPLPRETPSAPPRIVSQPAATPSIADVARSPIPDATVAAADRPTQSVLQPPVPPQEQIRIITAAFVRADQADDVEKILSFYAPQVDYFDQGTVTQDFIRRDVTEYGNQWSARRGELIGPVAVTETIPGREWVAKFMNSFYRENAIHSEWIQGELEQTYRFAMIGDSFKISSIQAKVLQRSKGKLNGGSSSAGPSVSSPGQPATASEVESLNAMVVSSLNAASRGNIDQLVSEYAPSVDYFEDGLKSPDQIREDLRAYFDRWPAQQLRLTSPVTIGQMANGDRRLSFKIDFAAYNPSSQKSSRGSADVVWLVRRADSDSSFKIVSQKEKITSRQNQTISPSRGQPTTQRSPSRPVRTPNRQASPPPVLPDVVRSILEQLLRH